MFVFGTVLLQIIASVILLIVFYSFLIIFLASIQKKKSFVDSNNVFIEKERFDKYV